mmetsp:Transcript_23703/g.77073  ORF Transcript_23703/g.77073 Transcript_23703/m.77073 type:complete len:261 (+) Transcript_23703:262-1044(+)
MAKKVDLSSLGSLVRDAESQLPDLPAPDPSSMAIFDSLSATLFAGEETLRGPEPEMLAPATTGAPSAPFVLVFGGDAARESAAAYRDAGCLVAHVSFRNPPQVSRLWADAELAAERVLASAAAAAAAAPPRPVVVHGTGAGATQAIHFAAMRRPPASFAEPLALVLESPVATLRNVPNCPSFGCMATEPLGNGQRMRRVRCAAFLAAGEAPALGGSGGAHAEELARDAVGARAKAVSAARTGAAVVAEALAWMRAQNIID